ncbi:MAG: DNA methyltransferase [Dehalococcoidia bacterium]
MSILSNLLRQVESLDASLAADLATEMKELQSRRAFGLNFERHIPETVELPGRPIRRADKVRFLPERGDPPSSVDGRVWVVQSLSRTETGIVAHLVRRENPQAEKEVAERPVDDLVVVAEFRDPIYPGLASAARIERGGDKPFHTVINAENYHALQALLYTHEGKVDAIYIDPPYNTRDKDWKYNNDYVDPDDDYAHSKWLAFMERRLKLARRLLNPIAASLIITIDEKEVNRLGLLLEQIFPGASHQMVTCVMSAKGAVRPGRFARVEEYIFFVTFGEAGIEPWITNMLDGDDLASTGEDVAEVDRQPIQWLGLRRREPSSTRGARPNQFYPIIVHSEDGTLHSIGDPIDDDVDRGSVTVPEGTVALWPLKPDGTEMLWGLTPDVLQRRWEDGYARVNNWRPARSTGTVQYLPSGTIERIESGAITVTGRGQDGSVQGFLTAGSPPPVPPKRVWNMRSHNAEIGGTKVLSALIPGRRFDYPKSLYAVEDALRFVVGNKSDAVVLDFFAGSGTTAHAVMRLNRQDGGRRRSITVTNNEVSSDEAVELRRQRLRPGDEDWERLGICEYITKPRLKGAVTGMTPMDEPISGAYRFTDEFSMAEGLAENVEFFTMTYEAQRPVAHNRAFEAVAPLLWMKAGSQGHRIDKAHEGYKVADTYGILFDLDHAHAFLAEAHSSEAVRMAFVVTDDDRGFQMVCRELPDRVEPVRLYESYLTNFTINTARD